MKSNHLAKIATAGIIGIAPFLNGCMTNDALKVSLLNIEYERKAELGTPKEHIPEVSGKIYRKSQVYENNEVTQETANKILDSAFKNAYQNRR